MGFLRAKSRVLLAPCGWLPCRSGTGDCTVGKIGVLMGIRRVGLARTFQTVSFAGIRAVRTWNFLRGKPRLIEYFGLSLFYCEQLMTGRTILFGGV